jgi:hypothetical protein
VGLQAGLDAVWKKKIPSLSENRTPIFFPNSPINYYAAGLAQFLPIYDRSVILQINSTEHNEEKNYMRRKLQTFQLNILR